MDNTAVNDARFVLDTAPVAASMQGATVALGNFDGMHPGHEGLVAKARRLARAARTPSAVLTFEPHPRRLFQRDPCFRLTTAAEKRRLILALGVDALFVRSFDAAFAAMPALAFVDQVLVRALSVRHVLVGSDFSFGRGREGDVSLLADLGAEHGFGVTIVAPVLDPQGAPYSSTRVRDAIAAGDMIRARTLLGRPWRVTGRMRMLGGQPVLGFGELIRPPASPYVVAVRCEDAPVLRHHPVIATVHRAGDPEADVLLLPKGTAADGALVEVEFLGSAR